MTPTLPTPRACVTPSGTMNRESQLPGRELPAQSLPDFTVSCDPQFWWTLSWLPLLSTVITGPFLSQISNIIVSVWPKVAAG